VATGYEVNIEGALQVLVVPDESGTISIQDFATAIAVALG